jgi:hypothetical protein
VTDQCDRPARLDLEVDVAEHRPLRLVAEVDAAEPDPALAGRELDRVVRVRDVLRLVDDLEDPLAGGGCALRLADPHAEHAERQDEHHHEQVEDDELVQRQRAVHDHAAADEQDAGLREERQEGHERHVEGALPVRADALLEHRFRPPLELRLLGRLLRERLHDVDADDALLGDGRHVGHPLLDVAQERVRDVAVPVCEGDEQRRDRERDEREPPVDDEHDAGDADDRKDVLEEEDQAVAEEEAHRLQVDRRAGHQLPRLVAIVKAERQPDEPGVERVSHVELDTECLPPGDEPAADHQQGLHQADRDDRGHDQLDRAPVVPLDRLPDRRPRQERDRDLRRLGGRREHDRDNERELVGAQEPEQAGKRVAIRGRFVHSSSRRRV